ncbi:Fur family transcriptional regulator [Patulibacter defluvii]|uniref:Fur family transcriptional regulator n=1 Tax=Patulibacter defluvii TaxID=3095358 RepID=UPI002A756465|nr:transcriptional repressor [Patulibacter sp. DM4]
MTTTTGEIGERWLQAAGAALRTGGHRVGAAREAVLEELAGSGGCCSAAELELRLRRGVRPVGDATVYRTLNLLGELGLVQPFDPGDRVMRFELVLPSGEHHHHAVCERCGATVAFEDEGLEQAIARVADRTGYRIDAHDLVLRGACPDCA